MILKLIWALKSLMFPLKSLVCWLFSLLNNPLPGDRPALCQTFFLLCDFSQDLLSFKIGKIEKTENLVVIFPFFFPADHLKKIKNHRTIFILTELFQGLFAYIEMEESKRYWFYISLLLY